VIDEINSTKNFDIDVLLTGLLPFLENLEPWISQGIRSQSGNSWGESKKSEKSLYSTCKEKFVLSKQLLKL